MRKIQEGALNEHLQDCALAGPLAPWQLTFAFGQPGKNSFCTKRTCWTPNYFS